MLLNEQPPQRVRINSWPVANPCRTHAQLMLPCMRFRGQGLFDLDALRLGLNCRQAHPGHFRVDAGHAGDHAYLVSGDLLAVGNAAHGLAHGIVDLRLETL